MAIEAVWFLIKIKYWYKIRLKKEEEKEEEENVKKMEKGNSLNYFERVLEKSS